MKTPHVIRKNGMYYAHDSCGYVHRALMAEIYDEDFAKEEARLEIGIDAVPVTELSISADEIQEYIDRMEVMRDAILANQ